MNRENSDHLQERKEKISGEIVRDFDGKYYAYLRKDATVVLGLPEYVDYKTLRKYAEYCSIRLPQLKDLKFCRTGRKAYARIEMEE